MTSFTHSQATPQCISHWNYTLFPSHYADFFTPYGGSSSFEFLAKTARIHLFDENIKKPVFIFLMNTGLLNSCFGSINLSQWCINVWRINPNHWWIKSMSYRAQARALEIRMWLKRELYLLSESFNVANNIWMCCILPKNVCINSRGFAWQGTLVPD